MDSKIKIAYLIVNKSFPGLLKQIKYDRCLMENLDGFDWNNFTFLDALDKENYYKRLPFLFRGLFSKKLFAWLWLLKNARKYDYVIMRHMEFDPFSIVFAFFVRNRILVHHSMEVEELLLIRNNWQGVIASYVEKICGGIAVRTSCALLTVSRDLMDYQRESRKLSPSFPIFHFPNGIIVKNTPILNDLVNNNQKVEIGFMAGRFAPWHGLDLLLDYCEKDVNNNFEKDIIFHLIGDIKSIYIKQIKFINKFNGKIAIKIHGSMKQSEYLKIFDKCTIGIGSLAMYRIGLTDGCTLKVREMLAMGLPVFSGHKDTALPIDFPFYFSEGGNIDAILYFANKMSKVTRKEVRSASYIYIDKKKWVDNLADDLKTLHSNRLNNF
mgnify:CR=1 FL=1|tara:strand:+ start:45 stop:1187 length:1143 start_codon:yes stop_codon:yes gene_type:complete